jgi:hypothetical protein
MLYQLSYTPITGRGEVASGRHPRKRFPASPLVGEVRLGGATRLRRKRVFQPRTRLAPSPSPPHEGEG